MENGRTGYSIDFESARSFIGENRGRLREVGTRIALDTRLLTGMHAVLMQDAPAHARAGVYQYSIAARFPRWNLRHASRSRHRAIPC